MAFAQVLKSVIFSGGLINEPLSNFISSTLKIVSQGESLALLTLIYASAFYLTIILAERIGKPTLKATIIVASVWLIIGIFK